MPCKIQVAILLLLPCHQKSQEQQRGLTDAGWKVTTCDVGTSITRLGQTSAVGWGDWIRGEVEGRRPQGRAKRSPVPSGSVTALGNTLGHARHPSARRR